MNKFFDRVYVSGDIHADIDDLALRVSKIPDCSKDDLLILLGDCGFFYSVYFNKPENDYMRQMLAARLPVTVLCIQGNHEQPFKEMTAQKIQLLGGSGYESNGIYFAQNGTALTINGKKCLCVGGAYSVDKQWRLMRGSAWWEGEELTEQELGEICSAVAGQKFDYVFSHTCPYQVMPREVFLPGIDQSTVSLRTELYLQKIMDSIEFTRWFCGHFHVDKSEGKHHFLYNSVKRII